MVLKNFILAERLRQTPDGKTELTGITQDVWAQSYPARHPVLTAYAQLVADEKDNRKDHQAHIELVDDGFNVILKMNPQTLSGSDWKLDPLTGQYPITIIVEIEDLYIPKVGLYKFLLVMDGRTIGSADFKAHIDPRVSR